MLVDLTPPALIERLQAGRVYPAARVPAALNGFFRVENLEALREVALRQVAEDVEAKRLRGDVLVPREDRMADNAAPQAVAERLLVWRRRSRSRSGSSAAPGAAPSGSARSSTSWSCCAARRRSDEAEQLDALHRLASLLGAQVIVEEGDDVAEVAARVARERGTTYVLMGAPAPRSPLRRLSEPLPERLVRLLPGVDVRIVADRSKRERSPR